MQGTSLRKTILHAGLVLAVVAVGLVFWFFFGMYALIAWLRPA